MTKTRILVDPTDEQLQEIVTILKRDEPVVLPTETVYGLAANALSSAALRRIYEVKGRPSDNPLIVHVSTLDMARSIADIDDIYLPLIEQFWPGPLTILANKKLLPEEITRSDLVAIRMPRGLMRKVIEVAKFPLAAPSANISGRPSPTSYQHCFTDLNGRIELIVGTDVGCEYGLESTVVDGTRSPPVILRPGGISLDEIRRVTGFEKTIESSRIGDKIVSTPGMKYRHYAPDHARVVLLETTRKKFMQDLERLCNDLDGSVCVYHCHDIDLPKSVTEIKVCDVQEYGRQLYKVFREMDSKVDFIIVHSVDSSAVMNRIRKAAS